MSTLFREEVLAHRRQAWLGQIQLIRPVTLNVLTVLVVSIVIAIGTFFQMAHTTRKARIPGYLAPDKEEIHIVAPQTGQLLEKKIFEGQLVRKGDLLFVLHPDSVAETGNPAYAAARQVAPQGMEQSRLQVSSPTLEIHAPVDGIVTTSPHYVGQLTTKGQSLARLIPQTAQLTAHVFAPSSAMGFLAINQAILLRYHAYPYQKYGHFSGRIVQISPSPLLPTQLQALPLARTDSQQPLYRITVSLSSQSVPINGKSIPLRSGLQLDADLVLERRSLMQWVFESRPKVTTAPLDNPVPTAPSMEK